MIKNFNAIPFILVLISLLGTKQVKSQELISAIPVEGKNISNLSGSINDSISFHIIINKVDKLFLSKVHFFDKKKELGSFKIYDGKKKPKYLSFHVNDQTLTLIRLTNDGKVIIEDVNYINGNLNSKKLDFKPYKIYSHKNVTLIFFEELITSFPFAIIKNSLDAKMNVMNSKNKIEKKFLINFHSLNNKIEFINDKEFLEHGPILDFKGFYNGDQVFFTTDKKSYGATEIMILNPEGPIINKSIPYKTKKELIGVNSFIKDSLLFRFEMHKTLGLLEIFNIQTLKKKKTFTYSPKVFGAHNKLVMRGKDVTDSIAYERFYYDFQPKVGSFYDTALNIGVNTTTQNEYVVRIGHLDKNAYTNYSNTNLSGQNDAIITIDASSGSVNFSSGGLIQSSLKLMAKLKNTGNYFELSLDSKLEKTDRINDLKYYQVDIEDYDLRLRNLTTLYNRFYIPQKEYVRLITFDQTANEHKIYNLPIIEPKLWLKSSVIKEFLEGN